MSSNQYSREHCITSRKPRKMLRFMIRLILRCMMRAKLADAPMFPEYSACTALIWLKRLRTIKHETVTITKMLLAPAEE